MKKLLFILLVLISGVASGQGVRNKKIIKLGDGYYMVQDLTPITGYTRIFAKYEWTSGAFDSTLYAPRYNGVPTGARVNENSSIDGKIAVDTANNRLYFYSGGSWLYSNASTGGGTPTWQQTLTAGSTLTGNNTIAGGGFDLEFVNTGSFNGEAVAGSNSGRFFTNATYSQVRAGSTTVGPFSELRVDKDTLFAMPYNGNFKIDTLPNLSTQNTLLGWKQGTGQGQVGYVTLGSGLSLSSGVLNTSGTVATPISSLTAATGTNTINNADYQQEWQWNTSTGTGLKLSSSSTANNSTKVLEISKTGATSGGNPTYGIYVTNANSGVFPTNYGIYSKATGGNSAPASYAIYGISDGASSTNFAGYFTATGTGTQTGVYASGATYGLIVPSGGGSVGIGTSTPTSLLHVVPIHTTGIGAEFISSTTTSGTILDITGTSTALAANNEGLNIGISGANGTNGITATGARISVTNTNGTSGTNLALDLTASGATTANNALNIAAGALTLNGSAGTSGQVLTSAGASAVPTWTTPATGNVTKVGTPVNDQIGVWTGDGTLEGTAGLTYSGSLFLADATNINLLGGSAAGMEAGSAITSIGDWGINVNGTRLVVDDNSITFTFNAGTVTMGAYGAGAATFDASGNITSVSDVRLKNVRGNYTSGLSAIGRINPIIYKWKPESKMETEHSYIGFSAQNIQSALGSDAVGSNKDGYLSIQDRAILATLVNAIKEQQKMIEDLQIEIKRLKRKLN